MIQSAGRKGMWHAEKCNRSGLRILVTSTPAPFPPRRTPLEDVRSSARSP
jgi:hypothetical protein